jgi:hypothetical protein
MKMAAMRLYPCCFTMRILSYFASRVLEVIGDAPMHLSLSRAIAPMTYFFQDLQSLLIESQQVIVPRTKNHSRSQPTISRAIKVITPLIAEDLADYVPTADELDTGTQYIVDGTLLPCWSWAAHPELYSGKHKTTGMKAQVACTIYGQLAWISDPSTAAVTIITG